MISSSEKSVLAALKRCEDADKIASDAKKGLAIQLACALGKIIYPGLVIDLNNCKELLQCFKTVRVMRGNDRGTKIFRIESFPVIDVVPSLVTGSSWMCEATPISEKTGKDMDGSARGTSANRSTVALRGDILMEPHTDLMGSEYRAFCLDQLRQLLSHAVEPEKAN